MAKIKYSALVQEMRNKLNGSVASRNRYGNYWRNKTTPVNPQTELQQFNRARLASVSQAWRGLSVAQREGFAALASEHPFTDIFGDQHVYDGKAMFSKLNMNALVAGASLIQTAQPFVALPYSPIVSAEATFAADITVTMENEPNDPDLVYVIYATPALSPTINFVKNRYRQIAISPSSVGEIGLNVGFDRIFGGLTAGDVGKVVHFRVHLTNIVTGQVSISTEMSVVVDS